MTDIVDRLRLLGSASDYAPPAKYANACVAAAAEITRLREALAKLLEYEPGDRSEFRSDSKGDREFAQAQADFAAARTAIRARQP